MENKKKRGDKQMKMITDFNEMEIQELEAISMGLRMSFEINDGKIVSNEKIPTTPVEAE